MYYILSEHCLQYHVGMWQVSFLLFLRNIVRDFHKVSESSNNTKLYIKIKGLTLVISTTFTGISIFFGMYSECKLCPLSLSDFSIFFFYKVLDEGHWTLLTNLFN